MAGPNEKVRLRHPRFRATEKHRFHYLDEDFHIKVFRDPSQFHSQYRCMGARGALGSGAFGSCSKISFDSDLIPGSMFSPGVAALKDMKLKTNEVERFLQSSKAPGSLACALGEFAIHRRISKLVRSGVVEFFDAALVRDGPDDWKLIFLMEFMPGGDLKHKHRFESIYTKQAVEWMLQVTETAGRLHDFGFVHRDIHPGNILFDRDNRARLADFGMSCFMNECINTPIDAYNRPDLLYVPPKPQYDLLSICVTWMGYFKDYDDNGFIERFGGRLLCSDPALRQSHRGEWWIMSGYRQALPEPECTRKPTWKDLREVFALMLK